MFFQNTFYKVAELSYNRLVGMVGLEPTSSKEHRILSAARIPIPPHPDLGGKMRFELTPSWATTMRSTVKLLTTSILRVLSARYSQLYMRASQNQHSSIKVFMFRLPRLEKLYGRHGKIRTFAPFL